MSRRLLDKLKERFGGAILETHSAFGDDTAIVDPAAWKQICAFLRDDSACDMQMLMDLCGVDYPDRTPRIEVVAHLYSINKRHRLRLKARVGDGCEGSAAEIAAAIALGTNAAVVQVIGHTFSLYRRRKKKPEIVLPVPND